MGVSRTSVAIGVELPALAPADAGLPLPAPAAGLLDVGKPADADVAVEITGPCVELHSRDNPPALDAELPHPVLAPVVSHYPHWSPPGVPLGAAVPREELVVLLGSTALGAAAGTLLLPLPLIPSSVRPRPRREVRHNSRAYEVLPLG